LLLLPCCFHHLVACALLFALPYFCCLVVFATLFALSCSHLTVLSCWLMALLSYHCALLVDGPCCPAIAPWWSALFIVSCLSLLFTFLKYLLGSPHCYFIALWFIVTPCCFALSIGIPSSLSCVGGRAWNNTNKLHPTT
jgi:hypothetical protein